MRGLVKSARRIRKLNQEGLSRQSINSQLLICVYMFVLPISMSLQVPFLSLPPVFSFIEASNLLEPISISFPSQTVPIAIPGDILGRLREEFWYGNMGADMVFEYRAVEVPMEIALYCPNRNLTEFECRSIGITQSRGWVNYWRQSSERNVFLFRRARADIDEAVVEGRLLSEVIGGIECLNAAAAYDEYDSLKEFLIFPMNVFDSPNPVIANQSNLIEISSNRHLMEWQRTLFAKAQENLSSS